MTIWDFLYQVFLLLIISFLFIGWLGTKYDIVGRDKRNEELKLEIEKMKTKDETKKRKSKNKKRHYDR